MHVTLAEHMSAAAAVRWLHDALITVRPVRTFLRIELHHRRAMVVGMEMEAGN
jgi:hypothetical protein